MAITTIHKLKRDVSHWIELGHESEWLSAE